MSPFEFVKAINGSKEDLIRGSETPDAAERLYVPFVINKALSSDIATILYANEINQRPDLDKKLQNDYYLNSVRPVKRFSKWIKREENADVECIMEYYKVSYARALEYTKVLTKEQIDLIKTRIIKGGSHVQRKSTGGGQA
jgi:hypothetical protein